MTYVTVLKGIRFAFVGLSFLLVSPVSNAATFTVINADPTGAGSLRQALVDANTASGLDTIVFQIPGAGVHSIVLTTPLPPVTDPVIIDGSSQTGFIGQPLIELNGTSAGVNAGLRLLAGSSTVRGLTITHFGSDGIYAEPPSGTNIIQGNYLLNNGQEGIFINGSRGNMIGGPDPANRNVISMNTDAGVYLLNGGGNTVQGNYIGTTSTGLVRSGNTNNGIAIYNSSANMIGGTSGGARNLVSGNYGSAIYLFGPNAKDNIVQGNYLGTDISGTLAISNVADGVTLQGAVNNTIGGTAVGAGNVMGANGQAGIYLNTAKFNTVQGNYIGTDRTGKIALGNRLAGVTMSGAVSNLIGGTLAAARNVIAGNSQDGLFITLNSLGNQVQGNAIGVDSTGTNAVSNLFNGLSINNSASNLVGGTVAGARNLISGNASYGIQILNAGAIGNLIQGNNIGTDESGGRALGNLLSGVRIESPANTVGGISSGARNQVSGNLRDGIVLLGSAASGNSVQGNYVGTGPAGTTGIGNGRAGIGVSDAPRNFIGDAGAGNVIGANSDAGIYIIGAGATGNSVKGNSIGTDVSGTLALGNALEGLYLDTSSTNSIGGAAPGSGNLISANNTRGIFLTNTSWNVIQGNSIGTKADGVSGLGNALHAVEFEVGANNNVVGGPAGAGNRIAFSQTIYAGVRVRNGALNNAIMGNSIFSNAALGIDLGTAGRTVNDSCDTDTGANLLQNFPVITQAVSGNGTGIRGTLNSKASTAFSLQFFANSSCDGTGSGEGQIYLGEKSVSTDGSCNASFVATFATLVPVGYVVTATATDNANNTSEFSACVPVVAVPALGIRTSSSTQVTLSWTNTSTGFSLQETASLTPPVLWTAVPTAPIVNNNQFMVTLTSSSTNRFYLLRFE